MSAYQVDSITNISGNGAEIQNTIATHIGFGENKQSSNHLSDKETYATPAIKQWYIYCGLLPKGIHFTNSEKKFAQDVILNKKILPHYIDLNEQSLKPSKL